MAFNNRQYNNKQRLTQAQKDTNDKQWYKDQADTFDGRSFSNSSLSSFNGVSDYKRKKVNYDLFNNIINPADFAYVCQPYGAEVGELPANMTNRDIVSGKIKVLLGMEMKMPFSWRVVAVNEEATTRKEQEETSRIKQFVTSEIMRPIRLEIEKQVAEKQKGKPLSPQEQEQLQAQIEEQTQAQTPPEVRKYMIREHQDPAEILNQQILRYLIQKEKVNDKFNKGFKHSNLSGEELYYVGIKNGEPCMKVINPLFFDYGKSPDLDFIEESEWAVCEYRMTPSDIVSEFGSELTEEQIDKLYTFNGNGTSLSDSDFSFSADRADEPYTIRVLHTTWKSLRKFGFLTYLDANGKEQMKIVDENYKLNLEQGDISIEWEWIPEAHETYKILNDIYVYCRPVQGQYKDLDNLYKCNLPYYGSACDGLNSPTTAPMDRMKPYQYYHNIILYRIELLMASDKGKILAANIGAIPKSSGINTAQFQYFMEANKIAWFNPGEEGNKGAGGDVTNLVKEIDMSLASDIAKYIEFAEYIARKCGESIGITKQMEGAIGPSEAVSNTRQNLVQSSHIIQPYFELHNIVKGNVLTALLEIAKVAYSIGKPRKLSYILDDMSVQMLDIDQELLDNSTVGLFISNSSKAADAKQAVENLAQAALQNQQATLADIIKIIRSESVTEAEELLEVANQREAENARKMEEIKMQQQKDIDARTDARDDKKYKHETDLAIIKEEERRKTVIQQQTILSLGFNEDKDIDDDNIPDVLEVAQKGVEVGIKERKQTLDENKFAHQKEIDKEKLSIERKKANKPTSSSK